jgi:ribonucleoside-triphosphate reductase
VENENNNICGKEMAVYSRITGYYRPLSMWNIGKKEEFKDRLEFKEPTDSDLIKLDKKVIEEKTQG